ncbi:hypothetical protein [Phenylobacterium sp.]|uniref:hypothetical protein n=1 Tax=Phenylobacterium sp. TaxID=1871053 RepID=UPI002F414E83
MNTLKKTLAVAGLMAMVSGGALALSATSAAADVACNRYGECWRVREHYTTYPANLRVMFHDDAWWDHHRRGHYHWRRDRPDDHGYYSHGRWRAFER